MKSTLLKSLFFCTALFFSLQAKLQIITTVAGGTNGYSGDGGLALTAGVNFPFDVDLDAAGNMYIVQYDNNVVRKVNASTGIITTIAGNGTAGYSGDNGPATQAQLSAPWSAAVDSLGNIYIVDHFNLRVRKVDAITGIITTIAGSGGYSFSGDGGPAIKANLQDPVGAALDASGNNLYITEAAGNRIRKVNLSTGIITTIAGLGGSGYNGDGILATSATLNSPIAIAVDAMNNVYFTDSYNQRVRKINASDGIISTVAGNGILGHTGEGGLAKNAEIGYCFGIALDKDNNVFITDWWANYVMKINYSDSIITTVAGSGKPNYNGDGILATEANLASPYGIATDSKGNFYMAEGGNSRVRKVTIDSSALNKIFGYSYYDFNRNNLKDSSEPLFDRGKIVVKKNTDSIVSMIAFTEFRIGVDTGNYISSYTPFGNYYNAVPQSHPSSFSEYNQIDTVYFAMQPISGKRDLHIAMFSLAPLRPGFGTTYKIAYQNIGTDTIANGKIQLIKDSKFNFVSSSPNYSSINGNTIKWNFTNLKPLDTASIIVYFGLPQSETIGDTLHSTATISPAASDLTPLDDTSLVNQIVVGSFDPNDKTENHAGTISKTNIAKGDWLTYTIRFQNTGTYAAFNIVVKDTLSDKLDWNTLQMIDASHNYQLNITDGSKCTWYFNSISLADSNSNEPASHGYLVYRIKPKSTLQAGDIINNSAGIYFDYNLPVQTNTQQTIVQQTSLPVTLLKFTAAHEGKLNELNWSTSEEINSSYFSIERSSDGRDFISIGKVLAKGNIATQADYIFTDGTFKNGINYYRLKIVDKDGRFTYSNIQSVNTLAFFNVTITGNPIKGKLLSVKINTEKEAQLQISLVSTNGQVFKNYNIHLLAGSSDKNFDITTLPKGTYFINIKTPDQQIGLKFIKTE